jgi:hypothetical protein
MEPLYRFYLETYRHMPMNDFISLWKESYQSCPQKTLQLTAYLRDIQHGKGERDLSIQSLYLFAKENWNMIRSIVWDWNTLGRMDDWIKLYGMIKQDSHYQTIQFDLEKRMEEQFFRDVFWMQWNLFYTKHTEYHPPIPPTDSTIQRYVHRFDTFFPHFFKSDEFQNQSYLQWKWHQETKDCHRSHAQSFFLHALDTSYMEWFIDGTNGSILTYDVSNDSYNQAFYSDKHTGLTDTIGVSLFAKWFPSEGKSLDTMYHICHDVAKSMRLNCEELRKWILTPLRKYLQKYVYTTSYISTISKKSSNNILRPYLVSLMEYDRIHTPIPSIEQQWKEIETMFGHMEDTIWMVDMSGSMMTYYKNKEWNPMMVAMTYSLLGTSHSTFDNKVFTFSSPTVLISLKSKEETLLERVTTMFDMMSNEPMWSRKINLEELYQKIYHCLKEKEDRKQYRLIVFTDMKYEDCVGNMDFYNRMEEMFRQDGYQMPILIYWNIKEMGENIQKQYIHSHAMIWNGITEDMLQLFSIPTDFKTEINELLESERYFVFV